MPETDNAGSASKSLKDLHERNAYILHIILASRMTGRLLNADHDCGWVETLSSRSRTSENLSEDIGVVFEVLEAAVYFPGLLGFTSRETRVDEARCRLE